METFLRPSTQDINRLLADIAANRRNIKGLTAAKNQLLQGLQTSLQHKAQCAEKLSPSQIVQYNDFSRFLEARSKNLENGHAALKEKMRQSRIYHEIAQPHTNLAVVQAGLADIVSIQADIIGTLENIVAAGHKTSAAVNSLPTKAR